MKYKLALGCIFKNESLNMREWLNHYFNRGVEHVYMIDDDSDDDYQEILDAYQREGKITLFKNDIPKIPDRQSIAYNKFLLPVIDKSEWFMINDLDEFVYSPNNLSLNNILDKYSDYDVVYSNWFNFNSNGNVTHPKSIVSSCVKRMDENQIIYAPMPNGEWINQPSTSKKYIINTKKFNNWNLNIHEVSNSHSINLTNIDNGYEMIINHYPTQSKEFWEKVKMRRGDVNNWHPDNARNWEYYNAFEIGDIIDTRLKEQNEKYELQ